MNYLNDLHKTDCTQEEAKSLGKRFRISCITLVWVSNHGTMLQAYALQYYLEKLGYEVEIIDFQPVGLRARRTLFAPTKTENIIKRSIKFIPRLVCNLTGNLIAKKFVEHYIHLTKTKYKRYSDLQKNIPAADIYFVGSDQVWNTQNNNEPDDIKAYYLCFVPKGYKKISYASSFGKIDFTKEEIYEVSGYLKSFNAISVREFSGLETLKKMGVKNGVHVLDPTLLLSQSEWNKIINKKKPKPGYVFVYNLNRNKMISKYAKNVADILKLRIVNFADTYEFISNANNRIINNPIDFLLYIANSSYVVTDSFHGLAFSLIYNRQFVCFAPPKYDDRLKSLLDLTGLSNRMYSKYIDLKEERSVLLEDIDYNRVNIILKREKEKSKEYISVMLKDFNNEHK